MEILDLPLRVVSDSDFYSGVIPTEEAGGVRRRAKRPRIAADAAPKAKAVAKRGAGRRAAAAPVLAAAPAAEQAAASHDDEDDADPLADVDSHLPCVYHAWMRLMSAHTHTHSRAWHDTSH